MCNKVVCFGCGVSFESFGMEKEDGYNESGHIYCNSDCALETNTGIADIDAYNEECGANQ